MKKKGYSYVNGMANRASAVIEFTVRRTLLSRSTILAILILLIPTFISLYIVYDTPDDAQWLEGFSDFTLLFYLQFFVILYCLVYGSNQVHEEVDRRTITYLTTRGMKRGEILLYKYVGMVLSVYLMLSLTIVIMYLVLGLMAPPSEVLSSLDVLVNVLFITFLGTVVYGAMFIMLGTLIRWPLMVGLLYTFIWEMIGSTFLGNVRQVTVMYYLRSIMYWEVGIGDITTHKEMLSTQFSICFLLFLTGIFLLIGLISIRRKDLN